MKGLLTEQLSLKTGSNFIHWTCLTRADIFFILIYLPNSNFWLPL